MNELMLLTKLYSQTQRVYHTLEHIGYMFNIASKFGLKLTEAQKLAIWWHDAVYVPGSKTNEEDSVSLMWDYSYLKYDFMTLDKVERIILDTKHIAPPTDEESAIVCDLDMFSFADFKEVHDLHTRLIYNEFTAKFGWAVFLEGRKKFLTELSKKPVFYSKTFDSLNIVAHFAIEAELNCVKQLETLGLK